MFPRILWFRQLLAPSIPYLLSSSATWSELAANTRDLLKLNAQLSLPPILTIISKEYSPRNLPYVARTGEVKADS